jgi:hypothetical protein
MTKVQLKEAVLNKAVELKASKKLQEALAELLEQYAERANRDTIKRDKFITVDGEEYAWCIRHEVYEPITNFKDTIKSDKRVVACKLAYKHFDEIGKVITKLNKQMLADAVDGKNVTKLAKQIEHSKEIRAGRYNWADNAKQYPDIEGYIYDESKFIKED